MSLAHHWLFVASHGMDAPGSSLDTYEQCARCGALQHDYRHNGGQRSPVYPEVFKYGARIPADAPCLGLLGAARSAISEEAFDHRGVGAGGGDEDDPTRCRSTHPDDGLRCVFGADHRCEYHSDGERRWAVDALRDSREEGIG